MSSTPHISQEDLTLYSMQALTQEENRAVQAHLDGCAECRAALADVLADVALVGMSVEQQALPQGARQRFVARIANSAQATTPEVQPSAAVAAIPVREERVAGSRFGWLGWVAAAATLAIAAYLGSNNFKMQQQLNQDGSQIAQLSAQAERSQQLMDALTSPAAKEITLTESKQPLQPVGHARYVQKTGALIFVASNLHPVATDKTYELWLIPANGKAPIPAGLFRPDANGGASVVLPTLPQGVEAKAFGVTIEDAQGAATPTLPIVMAG